MMKMRRNLTPMNDSRRAMRGGPDANPEQQGIPAQADRTSGGATGRGRDADAEIPSTNRSGCGQEMGQVRGRQQRRGMESLFVEGRRPDRETLRRWCRTALLQVSNGYPMSRP